MVRQPKIYAAFIVFAAALLLLFFVAAPVQAALGIWGLLLTELMIAACGIIPVFIFRYDIRRVLPFRRPALRQVFGVVLLWIGTTIIGYLFSIVTVALFPEGMTETLRILSDYLRDSPILPGLFISVFMPAVCEETLCRGFLQHALGGIKSKWLIIAIVGILFGVFHMSPFRFFPTMVLGFALAFIMAETNNLILPMLFHFINNGISLLSTYASGGVSVSVDPSMLSKTSVVVIGLILFISAAVPWLLLAGARLLRPKTDNAPKQTKNRRLIASGIISAFCFVAGIAVFVVGMGIFMAESTVLNMTQTEYVSIDTTAPDTYPVVIREDGNYQLSYAVAAGPGAEGTTSFALTDSGGGEVVGLTAESTFGNTQKYLTAGEYTLSCEYDYENDEPAAVNINFIIMKLPG